MMILGWPFTFFMVCQICVLVAVAILEEVTWHLQTCNSWFYKVSESWPWASCLFMGEGWLYSRLHTCLFGLIYRWIVSTVPYIYCSTWYLHPWRVCHRGAHQIKIVQMMIEINQRKMTIFLRLFFIRRTVSAFYFCLSDKSENIMRLYLIYSKYIQYRLRSNALESCLQLLQLLDTSAGSKLDWLKLGQNILQEGSNKKKKKDIADLYCICTWKMEHPQA